MSSLSATLSGFGVWTDQSGEHARAVFAADGIRCAACSRAIDRAVRSLEGVERVNVNVATARVCVDWQAGRVGLPQILRVIREAGFKPVPLAGEASEAAHRRERHVALKRIGIAGLGMMQVMMYVLGVYIATPGDMDVTTATYLNVVGMLITTAVLFYSGAPFLIGALHDLRRRTLGMDVPVALALLLAYGASVLNTLRGQGQTYFDSVTMFVFFLGVGRYAQLIVRQRSLSTSEAMSRSLPANAARFKPDGSTERVPVREVVAGDRLSVPKGAVIPVDAELTSVHAFIDESLITGESTALARQAGELIPGGAVNAGEAIQVIVCRPVGESALASIIALLERAQSTRPKAAQLADRAASRFITAILLIAVVVAMTWLVVDPHKAFPAVLAVLVVTCPCALSLATPAAVAAACASLARRGLLVTRADSLERLADIDTVVLDKTGTLTDGKMTVAMVVIGQGMTAKRALAIAAALERSSDHPVAQAFAAHSDPGVIAEQIEEVAGKGIAGMIEGTAWRLGRADFVLAQAQPAAIATDGDALCLGNERGIVATFEMAEEIRLEAQEAVVALRRLGITPVMASGDRSATVERVARSLGIESAFSRLDPNRKVELVRDLQRRGHRALMIGDGINDGPVLASAHVSCAMGQGSAVAQAAADFVLLSDSLGALAHGVATARRMKHVIRQNLRWALIYNFAAVPLAALNLVPPWLAAIGMSASSLVVVLNAGRLARNRDV